MHSLKEFINKNIVLFILAISVFALGAIIGSFVAARLNAADSNELKQQLATYISVGSAKEISFLDILICECTNHLRYIPLMLLCALSVRLVVPGALILAVRGYQLGFSVSFVCGNFGSTGILITSASAFFSYMIAIPVYFILFVLTADYAIGQNSSRQTGTVRNFRALCILFLIAYAALCIAACLEGLLLPIFIDFLN